MKKKIIAKEVTKEALYGANPIIELLKAKKRKLISIYTKKQLPKSWFRIQQYLPSYTINIQYVETAVLDRFAGTTDHMGIVALVAPFQTSSKMFNSEKKPFILLLDSVQDVRNLGAILRSAYCAGVNGVVLCKNNAAQLSPAVFKASSGYAEHLDIYIAPSLKHAIIEIKKAGYKLYMAVIDGQDATQVSFQKPACLVIGNEETGISKEVRKDGELVTIPQRSSDVSYNASVAAGILLFFLSWKINTLSLPKKI